jgi:hypothetical protein
MEGRSHSLFTAIQVVAAFVLLWLLVVWKTPWNTQRYIGTALVVAGGSFIAVARYQLGNSFSARAEAHELVTRGLYSKIRNPIYVFGAVTFAGLLLVAQQAKLCSSDPRPARSACAGSGLRRWLSPIPQQDMVLTDGWGGHRELYLRTFNVQSAAARFFSLAHGLPHNKSHIQKMLIPGLRRRCARSRLQRRPERPAPAPT